MRGRYDEGWKEVIERFFPQFLDFFFPRIAKGIDFGKDYAFLDKELGRISKKGLAGRRVDKLVRVHRRDGDEQWLLVHIEVQGYPHEHFERRMYVYNYRIFDRYSRDVVSLAVLTDENDRFRPEAYRFGFGDFRLEMAFPVVKLLDYRERWEELEKSDNPFSVVVMAHLKAQETRRKTQKRFEWKLRLTRMLYERGYGKEEVLGLYRFIDWIISLPEALEETYHEEIIKEEEVKAMPYITTAERIGRKKGLEQGLEQGLQQGMLEEARAMVLEALDARFGEVPLRLVEHIRSVSDRDLLKTLHRTAVRCGCLEMFDEELKKVLVQDQVHRD